MKHFSGLLVLTSAILFGGQYVPIDGPDIEISSPMAVASPVVVVELFTSQGCSSCPAADALLNETILQSRNTGSAVIGLSYHVSYWNNLGWKDPYSSDRWTDRQKQYAHVMNLPSIYTPQIVVNGTAEFVGSDESRLKSAIASGIKKNPGYAIVSKVSVKDLSATIHYKVDREPKGEILNIAIVESMVQNEVPRGENKGLTLKHFNVVRTLDTISLAGEGDYTATLPAGKGLSVVLYIQERATLKVVGGTQAIINY